MTQTCLSDFMLNYFKGVKLQFKLDPPDTMYQHGYLAAINELEKVFKKEAQKFVSNSDQFSLGL